MFKFSFYLRCIPHHNVRHHASVISRTRRRSSHPTVMNVLTKKSLCFPPIWMAYRQSPKLNKSLHLKNWSKSILTENFDLMHGRLPLNANIMHYFTDIKLQSPHLNALVHVVLATPATQVSVERVFSALHYI